MIAAIDDSITTAPPLATVFRGHAAHAGAQAQQGTERINVEHIADGLGIRLVEARGITNNPRADARNG